MPENEPYSSDVSNKKILPRMSILILAVLVFTLAGVYYFNPSFLSDKLKENNPNKNLVAQNGNQVDSLIGGGTDQINNNQNLTSDISSAFSQKLETLQTELQTLENKFAKLNNVDKLNLSGGEITGDLEIQDNLILNSTATTENLIPQSDDSYDLGSADKGWDNAYIHQLFGSSILTIGDDDTSHDLTDTDDLLISGDLEVNGTSYFDGNINLNGNLISNLLDPVSNQDAATKYYVDQQMAGAGYQSGSGVGLDMSDGGSTFGLITNIGASGTDFTAGGGLTLAGIINAGSASAHTLGSLGITAGAITGITGLNSITSTELNFLSGVNSGIQGQIAGKQDALLLGDLTGTNGVSVSGGTGAIAGAGVSISIPQSIATSASPTFAGLTLSNTLSVEGLGSSSFLGGLDIAGNLGVTGDITGTLVAGTKVICASDTANQSGCDYTVGATDAGTRHNINGGTETKGVIDTAIDALPAGGGTVILRQGTYYLYSNEDGSYNTPGSIALDKANVTLHCDKGAYLEGKSTVPGLAKIDEAVSITASNVTVEGCKINAGDNGEIVYLITTLGASDAFLSGIKILNNELYGGTDGITTHWTEYSTIEGNYIHDNVLSGLNDSPECIEPEDGSRYITITNNKMYRCGASGVTGQSLYIHTHDGNEGMHNIVFSNNIIIGYATSGKADSAVVVSNQNLGPGASHDILISNNQLINTYIRNYAPSGFGNTIVIENNVIKNNPDTDFAGIDSSGDYYSLIIKGNDIQGGLASGGIVIATSPTDSDTTRGRLLIEGNIIKGNKNGINVNSCRVANINNNLIDSNGDDKIGLTLGSGNCVATINGNTITQHVNGLVLTSTVNKSVLIANNLLRQNTAISDSYGIRLDRANNALSTTLTGNTIDGFTTGSYLNVGKVYANSNVFRGGTAYDVSINSASSNSTWRNNTFETDGIRFADVASTTKMYNNTFISGDPYDEIYTAAPIILSSGNVGMPTTHTVDYAGGNADNTLGIDADGNGISSALNANYFITTNTNAAANLILQTRHIQAGKTYTIFNNSSYAITFKVSGQTGTAVAAGKKAMFMDNGTDMVKITADF